MEYDIVSGLQPRMHMPDHDDGAQVSGYIIVIGGTPWSRPAVATPVLSLGARALYSTPQIGAIYLGINPDG